MKNKMIDLLIRLPENKKRELEDFSAKNGVSQAGACRMAVYKLLEADNVTKVD